jgi:predicted nuclease of predicted toxin-antitoxin system
MSGWMPIKVGPKELQAFDRGFRLEAKFYADENVELVVVEILRDLGFDVLTASEAGLVHRDDADHFALAHREGRILLTYDRDFLNDRGFPPHRCSGVVVLDIQPLTRQVLEESIYLLKVIVRPYRELWKGSKILIVRDYQMTVWQREHDSGRRTKTRYRPREGRIAEEWVAEDAT